MVTLSKMESDGATGDSLFSAVYEGRLERVRQLIHTLGLVNSLPQDEGYILLREAIENHHTSIAILLLENMPLKISDEISQPALPNPHQKIPSNSFLKKLPPSTSTKKTSHFTSPEKFVTTCLTGEITPSKIPKEDNPQISSEDFLRSCWSGEISPPLKEIPSLPSPRAISPRRRSASSPHGFPSPITQRKISTLSSTPKGISPRRAFQEISSPLSLFNSPNGKSPRQCSHKISSPRRITTPSKKIPWTDKILLSNLLELCVMNFDDNIDLVELLLERGANIHDDRFPKPLLHVAIERGHVQLVRLLIDYGADVDIRDAKSVSRRIACTMNGCLHLFSMSKRKEDIYSRSINTLGNIHGPGYAALHTAVETGNREVSKMFLEYGAEVNVEAMGGITPLHIAVNEGHVGIAEDLLQHGASIDSVFTTAWGEEYWPLHLAVQRGHPEMVKLLMDYGARVDSYSNEGRITLKLAFGKRNEIFYDDKTAMSIVYVLMRHLAAEVEYNIEENATNFDGGDEKILANEHEDIFIYNDNKSLEFLVYTDEESSTSNESIPIGSNEVENVDENFKWEEKENSVYALHGLKRKEENSFIQAISGQEAEYKEIVGQIFETSVRKCYRVDLEHVIDRNVFMALFIHAVVEKGFLEILRFFFETFGNLDFNRLKHPLVPEGYKLLHTAAMYGRVDVAESLICWGADVNSLDDILRTPIFYSVRSGDETITRLLLAGKNEPPDVNAKDSRGSTPLHFVSLEDDEDFWTKTSPRNPEVIASKLSIAKFLLYNGACITVKNNKSITPLHAAVQKGHIKIVELFLDHSADVNALGQRDTTPLHVAAWQGRVEIAKLLLVKKAAVNVKDTAGRTPLFMASGRNQEKIVEYLLRAGADVDARNNIGATSLINAAAQGNSTICQILLKKKAYVNAKDKYGRTPIFAASRSHKKVVETLIKYGADIESRTETGTTPLMRAASSNSPGICNVLLNKNAVVNAKDNRGRTALFYASFMGYERIIELLLKFGADVVDPKSKNRSSNIFKGSFITGRTTQMELKSGRRSMDILKAYVNIIQTANRCISEPNLNFGGLKNQSFSMNRDKQCQDKKTNDKLKRNRSLCPSSVNDSRNLL